MPAPLSALRALMPDLSVSKILGWAALIGVMSAAGASAGFRFTGPGRSIELLAQTDTVLFDAVGALRDTLHSHDVEGRRQRDTMLAMIRPINIYLCLNEPPQTTALMQLDCDTLLGQARNAAILRAGRPSWERRP